MAKAKIKLDRAWVVENRSKVQKRTLSLYEFGGYVRPDIGRAHLYSTFGILVGIVFSLWRAVFLINVERNINLEIQQAKRLLEILVDTNTVGFAQDRETGHWMAGYYVNNSLYRLFALTKMESTIKILDVGTLALLNDIADPARGDDPEDYFDHFALKWEQALNCFDAVFADAKRNLQDELDKEAAPNK